MYNCTICSGDFDPELEGGTAGSIGMLPVFFCVTCTSGLVDFVDQMYPDFEEE